MSRGAGATGAVNAAGARAVAVTVSAGGSGVFLANIKIETF